MNKAIEKKTRIEVSFSVCTKIKYIELKDYGLNGGLKDLTVLQMRGLENDLEAELLEDSECINVLITKETE